MNNNQFNQHVKDTQAIVEQTLCRKADEYGRGDRLSNFHQAAAMLKSTPEKALLGFVTKHIVALIDLINDLDDGVKVQSQERWDEKILDIIAYMILLRALAKDRNPFFMDTLEDEDSTLEKFMKSGEAVRS